MKRKSQKEYDKEIREYVEFNKKQPIRKNKEEKREYIREEYEYEKEKISDLKAEIQISNELLNEWYIIVYDKDTENKLEFDKARLYLLSKLV